jgi:hypothetical protein
VYIRTEGLFERNSTLPNSVMEVNYYAKRKKHISHIFLDLKWKSISDRLWKSIPIPGPKEKAHTIPHIFFSFKIFEQCFF